MVTMETHKQVNSGYITYDESNPRAVTDTELQPVRVIESQAKKEDDKSSDSWQHRQPVTWENRYVMVI